jgi:pSer/pThr/pTyr-binding forkhead associated (FHA) protein
LVKNDPFSHIHLEAAMSARITLMVLHGGLDGMEFIMEKRGRYIVGRAEDCDLCLSGGADLASVSRHHCALEVEPPGVSVRDLGSRNGTYVNGELIGRRTLATPLDESHLQEGFMAFELDDGDILRLGSLVFRVGILDTSDAPQPVYLPVGFQ